MSTWDFGTGGATLTADSGPFRRGIGQAQSALEQLEPVVARQWWGLQNLGTAFAAVGGAVAAGIGLAVREAVAWEDAMIGVERTSGLGGAELDALEASLRQVAQTTPIAVHELAAIAEQAGALGVEGAENIAEFSRIMGTLTATTDLTSASTEDLGRTLNVLGVPTDQFERFASTLVDVGRKTAATESEILNITRRLAPMARSAGFTAAEVLGLGAAVISLGPRAEAGASAMTRTINDISQAVAEAGPALDNWAQVAGMSAEQFTTMWERDAPRALEAVIAGISKFGGSATGLSQVLQHLDQNNVRNTITLGALAGGIVDVENKQTSLTAINELARESWARNVAFMEVAERRAQSTGAQIQMLRNRVSEVANTVGRMFLPVLRFIVDRLEDLAAGFDALPSVVQTALVVFTSLFGGVTLLAGGLILLIGRVVLSFQTLRTLSTNITAVGQNATGAAAQVGILTSSVNNLNAATARSNTQGLAAINTNLARNFAGAGTQAGVAAGQFSVYTGETQKASGAVGFLGRNIGKLGKAVGIVGGLLAIGSIALSLFGNTQKKAAEDTEKNVEANLELVDAIKNQQRGLEDNVDAWVLNQVVMSGMVDTLDALKIEFQDLNDVIQGRASTAQFDRMMINIQESGKITDEQREKMVRFLLETSRVFEESAKASGFVTRANQAMGESAEDAAGEMGDLGESAEDAAKKITDANRATRSYVDAILSQKAAAFDVQDAQKAYNEALEDTARVQDKILDAEHDLLDAQNDHEGAIRDLRKAERDLSRARADQQRDLRDAEDAVVDARDRQQDSTERILDLEEKLNDLRSGPTMRELIDATNALARAQLNLEDAEQGVQDAEWNLQRLREEGSSARDIEDAERILREARQRVAEETANVDKADQDLNDTRDGSADEAEEIADTERELERARRDSERADRAVIDAEQELRDLRAEVAADTAWFEANQRVIDAQGRVRDSLNGIRDAERTLAELRRSGGRDELARAELDLEQALMRQAQANADAIIQQKLMNGETVTAADEARIYAGELEKLIGMAPTADIRTDMENSIRILRTVKDEAKATFGEEGPFAKTAPSIAGLDAIQRKLADMSKKTDKGGELNVGDRVKGGLAGAFTGAGLGATIGSIIPGVGTIAGAIIGGLVGGILGAFPEVWNAIKTFVYNYIIAPFKRFLGIESPSSVAHNWGVNVIIGFWNGLAEKARWIFDKVWNFAKDYIYNPIKKALGWLWPGSPSEAGIRIGEGMAMGIRKGIRDNQKLIAGAMGTVVDTMTVVPPELAQQFTSDTLQRLATEQVGLPGGVSGVPVSSGAAGEQAGGDRFYLNAVTDADPSTIVNEFMWAKRVSTGSLG